MARHGVPTPGQAIIEGMEWLKMDKAEFARRLGVSEDLLEKLIAGEPRRLLENAGKESF